MNKDTNGPMELIDCLIVARSGLRFRHLFIAHMLLPLSETLLYHSCFILIFYVVRFFFFFSTQIAFLSQIFFLFFPTSLLYFCIQDIIYVYVYRIFCSYFFLLPRLRFRRDVWGGKRLRLTTRHFILLTTVVS